MTTIESSSSDNLPARERSTFEARRVSRLAAVQALFQIEYTQSATLAVIQEFIEYRFKSDEYPCQPDDSLFKALVLKTMDRREDVLRLIDANLSQPWTYLTLEPVLRAVLQSGALELLESLSKTPAPVIISEYIDITKGFLGHQEAQLTNAVLDKIARALDLPMKKSR